MMRASLVNLARRLVLLSLVLGGLFSPALAQDAALLPEEVANLYLRSFVNVDVESARKLNDYLRGQYPGRDVLNVAQLTGIGDQIIIRSMTAFAQEPPVEPYTQELQTAFMIYLRAQMDALQRSDCRARAGTGPRAHAEIPEALAATVPFTCKIPNVTVRPPDMTAATTPEARSRLLARALREFAEAMRNAPVERELSGEIDLTARDKTRPYWENHAPGALLERILSILHPPELDQLF
ncbi:MAG: hypothetical protein LBO00_02920 [Zoogloeaceae bacterium]|jgi:hypothetical protein|nr:hypothetical protein [Zoogloeaceae bacterium]